MPSVTKIGAVVLLGALQYAAANSVLDEIINMDDVIEQYLFQPTPERPHAPWSHEPYCATSTSTEPPNGEYCVFTSNTTGPHGLSLLMAPKDARKAARFLGNNPLDSFFETADREASYGHPDGVPWRIAQVPGKDEGVIATRKIKQHQTFMLDQAAVFMDVDMHKALKEDESMKMLKLAVDRALVPGMIREMSAKGEMPDGKVKEESELDNKEGALEEAILQTNAYGTDLVGRTGRGLFPMISKINHGCDPNSMVLFSREGLSMAIKAYRDIEPGEEITVSYLLLGMTSRAREHQLHRWGFKCECDLCSLPDEEKYASDVRRNEIRTSDDAITALIKRQNFIAALRLAESTLGLIEAERIYPQLADQYYLLSLLFLKLEDRATAEHWGKLAWDLLGDLGYLGVGEERKKQVFDLERMMRGIGNAGGKKGEWGKLLDFSGHGRGGGMKGEKDEL